MAAATSSDRGRIRHGLRYVRRSPAIRATMLMAIASGMVFNAGVTLPLLATRVFHLGPSGFGAMFAVFGVGAVGGALLAAGGGPWPTGRRVRLLALLTGTDVVLTGFAPDAALAFAGLVLAGLLSIWFIALANTLVQVRTEPGLRGRVMGIWTMAIPGHEPSDGPAGRRRRAGLRAAGGVRTRRRRAGADRRARLGRARRRSDRSAGESRAADEPIPSATR